MKLPNKSKQPFDIEAAIGQVRAGVSPFPKAAMFELAERGFDSLLSRWRPASSPSARKTRSKPTMKAE